MRMRHALAAMTVVGCLAAPAAAAARPTLLTGDGHTFSVRPQTIIYTGDGTGIIGELPRKEAGEWQWRNWKSGSAYGVGTIWLDDCIPNCAAGTYHSHDGSVYASRVRHGHFTRMKLRFHYRGH